MGHVDFVIFMLYISYHLTQIKCQLGTFVLSMIIHYRLYIVNYTIQIKRKQVLLLAVF